MTDINAQVNETILELLSATYEKTASHLAEELRVEQPALYQSIMDWHAQEYNLGGCGTQMSPVTVIQQVLFQLHKSGQVQKSQPNGVALWRKTDVRKP